MRKTSVRVQAKGQVTIPKEIRKKLKVKPGDLVVFVETEAGVLVKPAEVFTEDTLRDEVTSVVRSIRERFEQYTADEIETLVQEAIAETRKAEN